MREVVPASIRRLVERLSQPAYVTGQRWDILAWNSAAAELFGDFGRIPAKHSNILLFVLTDPEARCLFGSGWAREAKRIVSLFRAAHDLWAGDVAFADLIEEIQTGCPEFSSW